MINKIKSIGRPLTRDEMKKIVGGNVLAITCTVEVPGHTYSVPCQSGYTIAQCELSGAAYCHVLSMSGNPCIVTGCSDGSISI